MAFKEYDDYKKCRKCQVYLNDEELEIAKTSKMPALCREHIQWAKEQIQKCVPLFQKMNLS